MPDRPQPRRFSPAMQGMIEARAKSAGLPVDEYLAKHPAPILLTVDGAPIGVVTRMTLRFAPEKETP